MSRCLIIGASLSFVIVSSDLSVLLTQNVHAHFLVCSVTHQLVPMLSPPLITPSATHEFLLYSAYSSVLKEQHLFI
jgi:hypothetical protein